MDGPIEAEVELVKTSKQYCVKNGMCSSGNYGFRNCFVSKGSKLG